MGTIGKTPKRYTSSYLGDRKFNLGEQKLPGKRNSAGIGYLMIPLDISRELWIKNCYRRGQVSLINGNERIDNVLLSKHLIQDLEFPQNPKELGTKIVWVSTTKSVIAIAIINKNDEIISISDDQNFSVIKKIGLNSIIEISGNVEDENLIISINSKTNNSGKLLINVNNEEDKGELNILVNGTSILESNILDLNILEEFNLIIQNPQRNSTTSTKISYNRELGFNYKDEFGNEIIIDKDGKFSIKNNSYSLTNLFNDIITQISAITVATAIGIQPILNKTQVEDLKNKVIQILK